MEINPQNVQPRDMYKLIIGMIQPRPIAWVSSQDSQGNLNLAPFSFFTGVCSDPPTVLFCPGIRRQTGLPKDTLLNVQETSEFVINVVSEEVAEAMNITATETDRDVNEFEMAGVTPAPSKVVKPPRVAESPISIECKLNQIVEINNAPFGGFIVVGTVVYIHLRDDIYIPEYKIDTLKTKPIGRLAGPQYTLVNNIFEMFRLPSQVTNPVDET